MLEVSKKTLWPAAKIVVNPSTCRWQDASWNYCFCSVFTKWHYSLCRQTRKTDRHKKQKSKQTKTQKKQVMFQGQRIHLFPDVAKSPLLSLCRLMNVKTEFVGKDVKNASLLLPRRN